MSGNRRICGLKSTRMHPAMAPKVRISGGVSAHGHLIGPDPNCVADVVVGQARPTTARHALLNTFAFGGLNVSMAFAAAAWIS
jgi:3-oxoacyl-(acyl-carrier-protein) synthase